MDALSEILKVVQLNGAIFFNARFTAPWCVASPAEASLAQTLGLGAERVLLYHYMVEGSCLITLEGMAPLRLSAGDIIVFPHGDAHTMASSAGGQPQPWTPRRSCASAPGAALRRRRRNDALHLRLHGVRPAPVPAGPGGAAARGDGEPARHGPGALAGSLAAARRGRGGLAPARAEGVLAKLSEVMVVETLRRYVAQLSPEHTGWLSGLRDRAVGKCLALMHEKPAHPWTVDSLAREVGASRSVLAERFTHFVGQSPMQYLGRWRMALATNYLRRSSLNVARIAEEVGYETDAAFSRAFRREFGVPPATWRRMHASP